MFRRLSHVVIILVLAGLALGCATTDGDDRPPEPEPAADEQTDETPADDVQATAERLQEALAQSEGEGQFEPPSPIEAQANLPSPADALDADDAPAGDPWRTLMLWPLSATPAADPAESAAELTRQEMLERLMAELRQETDEPMARALHAVGLRLLDPERGELDPALLAGLSSRQRQRVAGFEALMDALHAELLSDRLAIDRQRLDRQLDEALGPQPIEIRHLDLARRVSGYGVYEPIERRRFLAGEDHRVILYVELDNFRAQQQSDGHYEVELEQEVVLYNEHDGLAVWRHRPVQILDRSRNRRRDFFVVQMITLPERLSVGKYLLKVRVTDVNGRSLDERTERIEIVAEASLLDGDDPD